MHKGLNISNIGYFSKLGRSPAFIHDA